MALFSSEQEKIKSGIPRIKEIKIAERFASALDAKILEAGFNRSATLFYISKAETAHF